MGRIILVINDVMSKSHEQRLITKEHIAVHTSHTVIYIKIRKLQYYSNMQYY